MKTDWRMIVARDPILRPLPNSTTFHLEVWEVYQSPEICSLTPYDENGTTSISLGLNSGQYDVITKGDNTTINFTVTIYLALMELILLNYWALMVKLLMKVKK